jgi:uncharacterized membrane protein
MFEENVRMIPEIVATLACGIFAGAAMYVSLVEQPARLSCGITLAVTEWRPSYRRGAVMQASLAVVGSLFAFASWWIGKDSAWLLGGILLFAVIPFTVVVIFPTNKELESDNLDISSAKAEQLLRRWSALHAVRGGLSLVAFVIFLIALQRKD